MTRPNFFEGVLVALIASLIGGLVFTMLLSLFSGGLVLRLVVAGIAFAYVLYLLTRSRERTGRLIVVTIWILTSGITLFAGLPLSVYLVIHLCMIWLIRSLYFYSSAVSSLLDLGLNFLSLGAAIWAGSQTNSIFLSIWCFFLLQALFIGIPKTLKRNDETERFSNGKFSINSTDRFERAYRAAQDAVRKLSSAH
jgi:hypothetical protein